MTALPNLLNFYKNVQVTPGCWYWTGTLSPRGYGSICWGWKENKHTLRAHRLAYMMIFGDIPEGMSIDHKCHNEANCTDGVKCLHRRCVNPLHLEAVTHIENCRRRPSQMQDRCRRGLHNLSIYGVEDKRGWGRSCRPCRIETARKRYQRTKLAEAHS